MTVNFFLYTMGRNNSANIIYFKESLHVDQTWYWPVCDLFLVAFH